MNVFLLLVRKELRDQRALLVASCVLAPICSALIAWAFRDATTPEIAGRWVLPGILGFFLAALATELATRDVGTAVGDTLARLPVPRRLHWAAKIAACAGAGVAFTAWLVAAEWTWRSLGGFDAEQVLHTLRHAREQHAAVIVATSAAFAFASVTRKGFASAGLAIALVMGAGYLLSRAPHSLHGRYVLAALDLWPRGWWPGVAASTFAIGSWLAFDLHSPRAGDVLRRAGLFLAPLALGFGATGALGYGRFRAEVHTDPRAADTRVEFAQASPDGRWIAMQLGRAVARQAPLAQVWVLDTERSEIAALPGMYRRLVQIAGERSAWLEGARLATANARGNAVEIWNARDGTFELRDAPNQGGREWVPSISVASDGFHVSWRDRNLEFRAPRARWAGASARAGVFFYFDAEGGLRRHELLAGSDRILRAGFDPEQRQLTWIDPEALRIAVLEVTSRRTLYLDAVTGETLQDLEPHWNHLQWTGLDDPWAVALAQSERPGFPPTRARFLGASSSWEVTFDGLLRLQVLANNRLLYAPGHKRLELRDHHGALVRTLFPLPDDVRVRPSSEASL